MGELLSETLLTPKQIPSFFGIVGKVKIVCAPFVPQDSALMVS